MIQPLGEGSWEEYVSHVDRAADGGRSCLPADAAYKTVLHVQSDYALPDEVLDRVRAWLFERGESTVYYFLTEYSPSTREWFGFAIPTDELNTETLRSRTQLCENVLTGPNHDWAIRVVHEGDVFVGGPQELARAVLSGFESLSDETQEKERWRESGGEAWREPDLE